MIDVVVSLSLATMCFLNQCYPVLVGDRTTEGVYTLERVRITAPGYGDDVLIYDPITKAVPRSIHRVYLGIPQQQRLERLRGPASVRRGVTNGCINAMPDVYEQLIACRECRRLKVVK